MQVTYFLGRESLLVSEKGPLPSWQKGLFAFMSRNSYDASKFFHLPTNRVIEIGIQIEL
jgi:KUP system potassium uptake protein